GGRQTRSPTHLPARHLSSLQSASLTGARTLEPRCRRGDLSRPWAFPSITNAIPKTNCPWLPPGHTTSGVVRTGECNHEMPGLPYPAFRRVDAEPGGGPSFDGSSYGERLGGHRCPGHRGLYPFEPQRGDLPQP